MLKRRGGRLARRLMLLLFMVTALTASRPAAPALSRAEGTWTCHQTNEGGYCVFRCCDERMNCTWSSCW
jgi:hypothetical protein